MCPLYLYVVFWENFLTILTGGSLSSFSQGVLALSGGGAVENIVVNDGVVSNPLCRYLYR